MAELRAQLKEVEKQLAKQQNQVHIDGAAKLLAEKKAVAAPVAIQAPQGVVLNLRAQPQGVQFARVQRLVRGANGKFVLTTEEETSPLVRGDYKEALEQLDEARTAMKSAEQISDALRALDRASKALMEARTALWKQRDEAAKSNKKDAPAPTEKSK